MKNYQEFKEKYGEENVVKACAEMLIERGMQLGAWRIKVRHDSYGMSLILSSKDFDIIVYCDGDFQLVHKNTGGDKK